MAKLNDIKGYWTRGDYNFNDKDMWEGKILLHEDGWFEGIVVDPHSSYAEDRFIFGVYHPDKVIELFKLTPLTVSSPFVFHGSRDAKGYDGVFEIIGLLGATPYGVSHIITQDAEMVRGNVDDEINTLEARIQRYKDSIMDETCTEFYNGYVAIRKHFPEIILRNYEGRGFTTEETQNMMEDLAPVNERTIQRTEEEVKKLVKQMPKDLFGEDDVLPF